MHATITVSIDDNGAVDAICSSCGRIECAGADRPMQRTTLEGRVKAHIGLHATAAGKGFSGEDVRRMRRDRDLIHQGRDALGPGHAL